MMSFNDERSPSRSDDPTAFPQDDLYQSGLFIEHSRQLDGARRGLNFVQRDHSSFRLRHDLVSDNQHIVIEKTDRLTRTGVLNQAADGIARSNFAHSFEADQLHPLHRPPERRVLSAA